MRLLKISVALFIMLIATACQSDDPLEANAGDDFAVKMGDAPTFDGCGSTGDIVNYKWTVVTPSDKMPEDIGKVIRETDANCSYTLEADMGLGEVGDWLIELEVRDGDGNIQTDTVSVEVTP